MNVEVVTSTTPRLRNGLATIAIHLPELGAHEVVDLDFDALYQIAAEPDPLVTDLVIIASICYVLDKSVPRRRADDFWTRRFEVEFPVSIPWQWQEASQALTTALEFLTGDEWSIGFRERPDNLFLSPRQSRDRRSLARIDAVGLFSGGIDSLVGTLDHLFGEEGQLALVGHHDASGPSGDQGRVHAALSALPGYGDRTRRIAVRLRPLPATLTQLGQDVTPTGREHTLRSRSLVFLALGLYAARSIGPGTPILAPENGFIAVNIPLTAARIGTCSTRTMHPYFLEKMGDLIEALGLSHPIRNTLAFKTKGESLAECRDSAALVHLLSETVSCAHASRRATWFRRQARNCGYCVPCLIRRAALHHIAQDNGIDYGVDILAEELDLDANVAADVRAMMDCLDQVRSEADLEERVLLTGPLPFAERGVYAAMVGRGLDELRALISDKGRVDLQQRIGMP